MQRKNLKWCVLGVGLVLLAVVFVVACTGPAGPAGTSTGTLSGTVTNSLTNKGEAGVKVALEPAVKDVNIVTDASGAFTATLPIGAYNLTFTKDNFKSATQTAAVAAGVTGTKNVALTPNSPVIVSAGAAQEAAPGGTVTLKAAVTPLDGSTVQSYSWSQTAGVPARIAAAGADTTSVTLSDAAAYKEVLLKGLKLQDRFLVQGINPHALEGAEIATFKVTVKTSSGTFSANVNVSAKLPYVVSIGIQNVPTGLAVLLNGKQQTAYSWTLAAPTGSKAALDGSSTRNPLFTPDVAGKYTLTESNSKATVDVYAGTWAGAISGLDAKGKPDSAACTGCHNGTAAPDKFTPWKNSGHAEIFTQNIDNPAGHWTISCAGCHTVGYDTTATNGGFDEAVAAENWKVPSHGEVGLYAKMLKEFPKTAGLANIQCENCHGPNNGSTLHPNGTLDRARINISSDVCGSCHGEPLRHGRFQQWEESKHAGTATTPARGVTNAHCGRCHSGQGFLAWIKQDDISKQIQGKSGNATAAEMAALGMTADQIQPVTCVVCHDPHAQGTVSGEPTEATRPSSATVRVMDVTKLLPAGFKAENVGKGALCITCHNTRNGPHNDEFPTNLPTSYSAPHTAAQGDMLLGQSAYLVEVGSRSPHASVKDSCVTCHMEATPPPPAFSYQGGGTNHAFEASINICGECHTKLFDGKAFQTSVTDKEHELGELMGAYLLKKMGATVGIQDYTPHTFNNKAYDVKSDAVTVSKDNIAAVEPTEPHGQQGFIIKFKTPVTFTYKPTGESPHTMSLSEAEVQLGNIYSTGTTPLIPISDLLVKVGWNLFLVEGDGSKGVHNPAFAAEVLNASIEAIKAATK